MKKLKFLYPILALAILLISLVFVPTTFCSAFKGNTECYEDGYRIFTELGKEQSDNYSYDSISLAHIFASSLVGNVLVSGLTPYLRI